MCPNCPFRKKGAIDLRPGRVEGIVEDLAKNDYHTFPCHKTTHGQAEEESACMGAIAYVLVRRNRLSVLARIALRVGLLKQADIDACAKHLRD